MSDLNQMIDSIKRMYDSFEDVKDPILAKQKLKFNLIYEEEIRFRKLFEKLECEGIKVNSISVKELAKIMLKEDFDFFEFDRNRMQQIQEGIIWFYLFLLGKIPMNFASAMISETKSLLEKQLTSIEDEIPISISTQNKTLGQLTENEIKAIDFNFAREFREPFLKRSIKIIEPFLKDYERFLPDAEVIEEMRGINGNRGGISLGEKYNDSIINQIIKFGKQMRNTPDSYMVWGENDYRNNLIHHLNANGNSRFVSAETYHNGGKTDILVVNSNNNIEFIAECKLWTGKNDVIPAIDQLFTRYVNWYDSNVAIIIFNKSKKGFTDLIRKAKEEVEKHLLCEKILEEREKDCSYSFIFRHPDDEKRMINTELIIFNFYTDRSNRQ